MAPKTLKRKRVKRRTRGTLVAVRLNAQEMAPLAKVVADQLLPDVSTALRIAIRYLPTVVAIDLVDDNLRDVRRRVAQLAAELGMMDAGSADLVALGWRPPLEAETDHRPSS